MHMLTIIRMYLGMSQIALAKKAGITQPDLCEMETMEPYGRFDKYRRVKEVLGIPLDAIVKNDVGLIPTSFFEKHPPQQYLPGSTDPKLMIGRLGEDFIFAREQERLREKYPIHAKLVLPLYKMKAQRIGCDILTYDDNGKPVCMEVKTTGKSERTFTMTKNELELAQKLVKEGEQYRIVFINNWGTPQQSVQDISHEEFFASYDVNAQKFSCSPKKEKDCNQITGLAYFRRLYGLKEREMAEAANISQNKWCIYETGCTEPPVQVVLRVSHMLGASIDELLETYDAREV